MNTLQTPKSKEGSEPNPLANIVFNILIPVVTLNQLSKRLPLNGPQIAVMVALAFPLGFGLHDWLRRRKLNPFSLVGLINVLITGSFALFALHGRWFILKEVALPLILATAIWISAFTRKPFVGTLFINPRILKTAELETRLQQNQATEQFHQYLKRCTFLLATSFASSAVINFFLARHIFIDIDGHLSATEQALALNQQIAHMTWLASLVILGPSLIFTAIILYYLLSGIRKLTGLTSEEVLNS